MNKQASILWFVVAFLALVSACNLRSAPTGKIAFTSTRDSNNEIYVMDVDGSNQVNLTNNPARDWSPCWSPDGKKIAFISLRYGKEEQIYVMDAGGSNQVNLTNNGAWNIEPSWSPDGKKIAFASDRDRKGHVSDIWLMDADGSNQVNLTNNPANDRFFCWSPDGKKIAFVSSPVGKDEIYVVMKDEIYVMDADGSNQVNLTNNPARDLSPCWSPCGKKIAFTSERDGRWEVYIMNSDGTNQTRLTTYRESMSPYSKLPSSIEWPPSSTQVGGCTKPLWSPDGEKLGFIVVGGGAPIFDIYVIDEDGSNQINLTHNLYPWWDFSWSPDSQKIVFSLVAESEPSDYKIYTIDADGSNLTRLTHGHDRKDIEGVWSPR